MQPGTAAALAFLHERMGPARVVVEPEALARYGVDRSTVWQPAPAAVVFPASVADIEAIVQLARAHRVALVPSGGRTGLSGGAVAAKGEIVVAMERMKGLLAFDAIDASLSAEAGMITADVQRHATERGLYYPVDFASSGSSQIGGNVATNAGGIKVIRYGMTRQYVTGLTVVDGRGEVLRLNHGLHKNNTGMDLRHLFIGSEGCLGIVAEVTLHLQPPPKELQVLLLAVPAFAAIPAILARCRATLSLTAFEFLAHNALSRVLERNASRAPLATAAPFYVLIEHELLDADAAPRALSLFDACMQAGEAVDGVQSESLAQARALWRLREDISESLARCTPWKNDIAVRVSRLEAFMSRVESLAQREFPGLELVWYGHVGDGNLHLNILCPEAMAAAEFITRCRPAARQIAETVREFAGSVSAEHGIGLLKKDYLACTVGETGVQRLRDIKRVFDPDGIMNPGKVVDS